MHAVPDSVRTIALRKGTLCISVEVNSQARFGSQLLKMVLAVVVRGSGVDFCPGKSKSLNRCSLGCVARSC